MKITIALIIILFFPALSNAQWINKWEKVNIPDRYSPQAYLDIYFLPSDRNLGWACGFSSQVSFTKDGGETWKTVNVDDSNPIQLESIHFVTPDIGFTSGPSSNQQVSGSIFRTDDGGDTWNNISPETRFDYTLWGTYFYDENNGFVVGGECDNQFFFKTTNGGVSWSLRSYNARTPSKLSDVFVDWNTGIGQAISSGLVWRTNDYGENWEIEFTTGPSDWHEELAYKGDSFIMPIDQSCFGSQNAGYGGMQFTTDRGQSFNRRELPIGTPMYGSFLINENTGWVCGFNGSAYFTCDAGVNWQKLDCGLDGDLDDIFFIDDTTGWVVGDDIFRTKNVSDENKIVTIDTIRVCEGEIVNLEADSTREFANYNWSQCGFGESTFSVGEGKYRVYAYNDPCDTAFIYDYVVEYYKSENPNITASTDDFLCEGDSVFLTENSNVDLRFWSTGDTTRTIKVTQSGTYIVTTISPDDCLKSDTITVTFKALPEPNIIPITENNFCIGDSILLESEFEHNTYQWIDPNDETISDGKSIFAKIDGNYKLIVTNEFGCSDTSAGFKVDVRIDSNRLSVEYTDTDAFVFDTLTLSNVICMKMIISNKSQEEYLLRNIKLEDKYYFAIPPSNLPVLLEPLESIEIDICFSGDSIGFFSDRVELSDVCKPHFYRVEGEVAPFELNVITKCDVPWKFTSVELDRNHVFESSSPFPNPSTGLIAMSFIEYMPDSSPRAFISLHDNMGNHVADFEKRVSEIEYYSNGLLERGEYILDLDLRSGVYFIVTNGVENSSAIPIVISQ